MIDPAADQSRVSVPLALVHHANQYLITDGYSDRDGMGEIIGLRGPAELNAYRCGLLPLLHLHLAYGIPLNLHISGTLLETLAWHYPNTFAMIRRSAEAGLLEIVGSTLSQNVMPFFSARHNRQQLQESLWLYQRHLGWLPERVKTFWVPERVWRPEHMATLLRSADLPNGGYRYVLLDDRLVFPVGDSYAGSERERFDRSRRRVVESFLPWEIEGSGGLIMLPISMTLRYLIPPTKAESFTQLEDLFTWLARGGDKRAVAIYGDDLERAAGVGGWNGQHPVCYERLFQWLAANRWVKPVLISDWAATLTNVGRRTIEAGTFYELAQEWKAGEDYRGWFEDPNCFEHRQYFRLTEQRLIEAEERGADPGLLRLGWQHLRHCAYETSWHDRGNGNAPGRLAPWAAALSSHSRSSQVIALAAEWFLARHHQAEAEVIDVDRDDEDEVVIKNDSLLAIFSPRWGGRLVYLFDLSGREGRLVIGNVSDDWNLQEELNRYMESPRNHPGAFADVGHENDRYHAAVSVSRGKLAAITMRNVQPESPLYGTEKRVTVMARARHLGVTYQLPPELRRLSTEVCLSPDYARMLRWGRRGLRRLFASDCRGWRNGRTRVWLRIDPRLAIVWDKPFQPECGHGLNLRVTAFDRAFRLDVGVGQPNGDQCSSRLRARPVRAAAIDDKPARLS